MGGGEQNFNEGQPKLQHYLFPLLISKSCPLILRSHKGMGYVRVCVNEALVCVNKFKSMSKICFYLEFTYININYIILCIMGS